MIIKVEYIRNLNESFMKIEQQIEDTRDFSCEEKMILNNTVKGLLTVKKNREDDKIVYYYNITGMQSLDSWLETRQMEERNIKNLLVAVCTVVENIEKYLLNANELLLAPENVFVNREGTQFLFCYCIGEEQQITEGFRALIEYLLKRLNHKDKQAVEVLYGVYEETLKVGYNLEQIRNILFSNKYEIGVEEKQIGNQQEIYVSQTSMQYNQEKEVKKEKNLQPQEYIEEMKENWINTIKAKADTIKSRSKKRFQELWLMAEIEKVKKERKGRNENGERRKRKENRRIIRPEEQYVFEPEEESIKQGKPTVLLAERKTAPKGILRYEGDKGLQDIRIEKTPFIIGSGMDCDGRLELDTISRIHARITKNSDIYFIEDLNSSNGTMTDGKVLQYKVKESLEENELISFAGEEFRFI